MSRRIRQHVNPLALHYLQARATPVMVPTHLGRHCPVEVELGCADGQFSFELAAADTARFVVGLDIRRKIIDAATLRAQSVANLRFAYANLGVDLGHVFGPRSVDRFHLLFPDPWVKPRHRKRRVLEPGLLLVMHQQLRAGGELHVATDVFEVALEAMSELEASGALGLGFRNLAGPWRFWRGNPFGARSRREQTTRNRGQRVWRIRYCVETEDRNR